VDRECPSGLATGLDCSSHPAITPVNAAEEPLLPAELAGALAVTGRLGSSGSESPMIYDGSTCSGWRSRGAPGNGERAPRQQPATRRTGFSLKRSNGQGSWRTF
jgi:hypothetical protein